MPSRSKDGSADTRSRFDGCPLERAALSRIHFSGRGATSRPGTVDHRHLPQGNRPCLTQRHLRWRPLPVDEFNFVGYVARRTEKNDDS
jgi:hypothetical protein